VWRFKLAQVHRYAAESIACPDGLDVLAREVQRVAAGTLRDVAELRGELERRELPSGTLGQGGFGIPPG